MKTHRSVFLGWGLHPFFLHHLSSLLYPVIDLAADVTFNRWGTLSSFDGVTQSRKYHPPSLTALITLHPPNYLFRAARYTIHFRENTCTLTATMYTAWTPFGEWDPGCCTILAQYDNLETAKKYWWSFLEFWFSWPELTWPLTCVQRTH